MRPMRNISTKEERDALDKQILSHIKAIKAGLQFMDICHALGFTTASDKSRAVDASIQRLKRNGKIKLDGRIWKKAPRG